MKGAHHAPAPDPTHHAPAPDATRLALAATRHCLTGCAIGEVLGLLSGMAVAEAVRLTLAADTISIVVMEAVDNLVVLLVPGAMEAGLDSVLFWASLAAGFAVAFAATSPVNRWLIVGGRGHALAHGGHA